MRDYTHEQGRKMKNVVCSATQESCLLPLTVYCRPLRWNRCVALFNIELAVSFCYETIVAHPVADPWFGGLRRAVVVFFRERRTAFGHARLPGAGDVYRNTLE